MSKRWTRIIALVSVLCFLFSVQVFAGKGTGSSKKKKSGFFTKVGKSIKKVAIKTKKAIKKASKKTAKAVKKAAKKTGKAIKNCRQEK